MNSSNFDFSKNNLSTRDIEFVYEITTGFHFSNGTIGK